MELGMLSKASGQMEVWLQRCDFDKTVEVIHTTPN